MKKKLSMLLALIMMAAMVSVCFCGFATAPTEEDDNEENRLYGEPAWERTYTNNWPEIDYPVTWRTNKVIAASPDYVDYSNTYCGPVGGAQVIAMSDHSNDNAWPAYQSWTGDINNPTMKPLDTTSRSMINNLGARMSVDSGGFVTQSGFMNGMNSYASSVGLPIHNESIAIKAPNSYPQIESALLRNIPVVLFAHKFEIIENWYIDDTVFEFTSSVYNGGHIMVIDSINYINTAYYGIPIKEIWFGIKSPMGETRVTYTRGIDLLFLSHIAGVKIG